MGIFGGKQAGSSDWRVGHRGRDNIYYEELINGSWLRIEIQGEMLMGEAHHVIYFASPEHWQAYPEWARQRRAVIVERVCSQFHPPEYLHDQDQATKVPQPSVATLPPARNQPHQVQGLKALVLAVVLMATLGVGLISLAATGVNGGETYWPLKRATQQRQVSRAQEPAMFWFAISLYGVLGVASLGLGVWGAREGWRLVRRV